MLSRSQIHGRIEEDEVHLARLVAGDASVGEACRADRNPSRWDAWFDVATTIMGADWRDLDADWWRAQFDRERSPVEAIRLFLEEAG